MTDENLSISCEANSSLLTHNVVDPRDERVRVLEQQVAMQGDHLTILENKVECLECRLVSIAEELRAELPHMIRQVLSRPVRR